MQKTQTIPSKQDRAILRACGYPLPADQVGVPSAETAAEVAIRALEAPSARLAKAATVALLYAARQGLESLPVVDVEPAALRRTGFLLQSLSRADGLDPAIAERLRRLADTLDVVTESPVPLGISMSNGLLRRLVSQGDPLSERWGVYGRPEIESAVEACALQ